MNKGYKTNKKRRKISEYEDLLQACQASGIHLTIVSLVGQETSPRSAYSGYPNQTYSVLVGVANVTRSYMSDTDRKRIRGSGFCGLRDAAHGAVGGCLPLRRRWPSL